MRARLLRVSRDAQALSDKALALRYGLLRDGWPPTHPLCLELDRTARHWAALAERHRRAGRRVPGRET
jgi:hypothetical protein